MRISDWSSDVCSSDLLADAERPSLGVVLAGNRRPRHWATGKAQGFDAFDAKTEALALLSAAGAPVDNIQVFGDAGAAWHPGQSGTQIGRASCREKWVRTCRSRWWRAH